MLERIKANFNIAFEAVLANKIRSVLTALGIIFGVAAVISMLAIGAGAQEEINEQIKLVGVNNIVIEPIVEQTEEQLEADAGSDKKDKKFSPGLNLQDVESISEIIPGVARVSPEIIMETHIINNGIRRSAKLVGIEPSYFELSSFSLQAGNMFSKEQRDKGSAVCIIGQSIKTKFFPQSNPIGKKIKVGPHWLEIIGVLQERYISEASIKKLGIRDYNMDVYVPIQTFLIRYKNRALVTSNMLRSEQQRGMFRRRGGDEEEQTITAPVNYHQIDKMVVQVAETEMLTNVAEVLSRLLERRHYGVIDFEVTIPELLLKQQQRTNQIFNIVLFAIASISLVVGGIGIMNIMLASVLERIKEIGLRMALGAKKIDIVLQFLLESVLISVTGGIIGVIIGFLLAVVISRFADIPTIVTVFSIVISFGVAATVGLIFGIAPARRAAKQDPITSLRYE